MSEENKALYRSFIEDIMLTGNVDKIDEVTQPDFVEHETMPEMPEGREAPKWYVRAMQAAFSNLEIDVGDMIAEGDRVAARLTMRGTHTGEFMGIPATGKSFEIQTIDIVRFKDGKAAEHWGVTDALGMMQQLGLAEGLPG